MNTHLRVTCPGCLSDYDPRGSTRGFCSRRCEAVAHARSNQKYDDACHEGMFDPVQGGFRRRVFGLAEDEVGPDETMGGVVCP